MKVSNIGLMLYYCPFLQYKDIAANLPKGQFLLTVKNGSDIYEYVLMALVIKYRLDIEKI